MKPLALTSRSWVKIKKKSYMEPLCITDPEYGGHDQKIGVSVSFYNKLAIFIKTVG
jgi:hypothetical protein